MGDTLVLLNARAGTLIDAGPEQVRTELCAALAGGRTDVRLVKPRHILDEIRRGAQSSYSTIVVGGGDGSASCAVNALAGTGKTLGVLPFGTINLLARDLNMPADIHEAIAALARAKPRSIDLARVNGRAYHSLSGLGFFSQMARAREEVRGHRFGRLFGVAMAGLRALIRTDPFRLHIRTETHSEDVEALAVLVTNNRFNGDWRRKRLDEGLLEVHIAENAGALAKLKASANLVMGGWREVDDIRSMTARRLVIERQRSHTWAATDGELLRERTPLRYEIMPAALTVLSLPPPTDE